MVQTICVCGAGTMGSGIAQVAAQAGFRTVLYEPNPQVLEKAISVIGKNLRMLVEKQKISDAEKETIEKNLQYTDNSESCRAPVIIEAIVENPEIKIGLFNRLAEINDSQAIFASNTSSLSITDIARYVKNSERVIGMHFFNPAPVMKLVEIVNTPFTNEMTTAGIKMLAEQLGKIPVICKDSPGFIVNRVARPYYIEALRLLEESAGNIRQLDTLLEASGFRMGPFKLMDLIGNDINYAVSRSVYEQLNRPERLKPSHIQKEKVEKGQLGRKTGQGYYDYNSGDNKSES